ncbi:alpha/beta-hydrolase, partial [Aureobasidium melanogenum]
YRLIKQQGANSSYVELQGKNHWFDGIMTTEYLSKFFEQNLNDFARPLRAPEAFTLAVANPADSGSKFGVEILYLRRPGQLAKVHVSFSSSDCILRSSNVLSLRLPDIYPRTHGIVIDGQRIDLPLQAESNDLWLYPDGTWKVLSEHESPALRDRNQLGGMDAIFRTQNTLQIISHCQKARHTAVQISRNFCQYLGADTEILESGIGTPRQYSNIVRLVLSDNPPASHLKNFAFQVDSSLGISIRTTAGQMTYPSSAGLGAIFLRPLPAGAVELVVWGHDADGLDVASRLVPMLPGVGQPDFVVADKRMLQEGAGGVLAMGSFDHLWNVTENSYFT